MIFKTLRQEREWAEMIAGKFMIVPIVLYAAEISRSIIGKQPVVTGIHRSDSEHRALLKKLKIEYYPTVHSYWRGTDLRSWIYDTEEIDVIVDAVNSRFSYGRGKQCAIFHDVGAGSHFHLQSPSAAGKWTI